MNKEIILMACVLSILSGYALSLWLELRDYKDDATILQADRGYWRTRAVFLMEEEARLVASNNALLKAIKTFGCLTCQHNGDGSTCRYPCCCCKDKDKWSFKVQGE